MKDYRLKVTVRNNRILKAIEAVGGTPGGKWCASSGLEYTSVNDLIGLKASPLNAKGVLSMTAAKLCDVLGKLPEDLWSQEQLYPLERNFSEIEMSHEQITALLPAGTQPFALLDTSALEHEQLVKLTDLALSTLNDREQRVLRMRFEEEMTLKEIGAVFGVSITVIRLVEETALRKLRHPCRAGILSDYCNNMTDSQRKASKVASAKYLKELEN